MIQTLTESKFARIAIASMVLLSIGAAGAAAPAAADVGVSSPVVTDDKALIDCDWSLSGGVDCSDDSDDELGPYEGGSRPHFTR
jgi:hypothetical protein